MVVTNFKGEQPDKKAERTVATSRSGYRQTVPSEAEEDTSHEMHDSPPPYEASSSIHNHVSFSSDAGSTTSPQNESARMIRRPSSSSSSSSRDHDNGIDRNGYQRAAKMTWDEKDASGYWAKHEHETGACCSRRGGCVFSDRGGCCFSDREACCFSDRDACCFSDRDACCFSDRDACCCSEDGGCCFADRGGCCFSGTRAGGRWRLMPSTGTLFKGLC